jgi:hypothetical protein
MRAKRLFAPRVAMEYLTELPASVPWDGTVLVHNTVTPTRRLGKRGFQAWLQAPDIGIESCPCGWAPELGPHFRVRLAVPQETADQAQGRAEGADLAIVQASKTAIADTHSLLAEIAEENARSG